MEDNFYMNQKKPIKALLKDCNILKVTKETFIDKSKPLSELLSIEGKF